VPDSGQIYAVREQFTDVLHRPGAPEEQIDLAAVLPLSHPAMATGLRGQHAGHRSVPRIQVAVHHGIGRTREDEQMPKGVSVAAKLWDRVAQDVVRRAKSGEFETEEIAVADEGVGEFGARRDMNALCVRALAAVDA